MQRQLQLCNVELTRRPLIYLGHYMFLDAYNHASRHSSSTTSTTRLISPELPASRGYCVMFWYNLHGADVKTFNVYAKVGYVCVVFQFQSNESLYLESLYMYTKQIISMVENQATEYPVMHKHVVFIENNFNYLYNFQQLPEVQFCIIAFLCQMYT